MSDEAKGNRIVTDTVTDEAETVQIVTSLCAQALRSAHDALAVICLDEQIRRWLQQHDPKALEQADHARRELTAALGNEADGDARERSVDGDRR